MSGATCPRCGAPGPFLQFPAFGYASVCGKCGHGGPAPLPLPEVQAGGVRRGKDEDVIPSNVAAFAAGMICGGVTECKRKQALRAARTIRTIGLGDYDPEQLRDAALEWLHAHVSEDIVLEAVARMRGGGAQ